MKKEKIYIEQVPALLWGEKKDKIYLYVHGQQGCKEEASYFSEIACAYGWQVLSIDLPEHGERSDEINQFVPWVIVPELMCIKQYMDEHWNVIALYANSIGAYMSMLAFSNFSFANCLFISPILDMEKLIYTMMSWAKVDEKLLEEKSMIATDFGQTLSWEYLTYVKDHPIMYWNHPTQILYGALDAMSERTCVEQFAKQFACQLHVVEDAPHYFHTPMQLQILRTWERSQFEKEMI